VSYFAPMSSDLTDTRTMSHAALDVVARKHETLDDHVTAVEVRLIHHFLRSST
jgi:hypothetical protein